MCQADSLLQARPQSQPHPQADPPLGGPGGEGGGCLARGAGGDENPVLDIEPCGRAAGRKLFEQCRWVARDGRLPATKNATKSATDGEVAPYDANPENSIDSAGSRSKSATLIDVARNDGTVARNDDVPQSQPHPDTENHSCSQTATDTGSSDTAPYRGMRVSLVGATRGNHSESLGITRHPTTAGPWALRRLDLLLVRRCSTAATMARALAATPNQATHETVDFLLFLNLLPWIRPTSHWAYVKSGLR